MSDNEDHALSVQPMLHGEVYTIPHRINGTVAGKSVVLRMETEDDARVMHGIVRDVCFGIADVVRVMTPICRERDCPSEEFSGTGTINETGNFTLTAEEREAIEVAAAAYADDHGEQFAAVLRNLPVRL